MAEMRPEDVPTQFVQAGADAIHAHYEANPDDDSETNAIRILLAAVLSLHEQQVCKRIATKLGMSVEFLADLADPIRLEPQATPFRNRGRK